MMDPGAIQLALKKGPQVARDYTVRAINRASFHSISRAALKNILKDHEGDTPNFHKAIEHAAKIIDQQSGRKSKNKNSTRQSRTCGTEEVEGSTQKVANAKGNNAKFGAVISDFPSDSGGDGGVDGGVGTNGG